MQFLRHHAGAVTFFSRDQPGFKRNSIAVHSLAGEKAVLTVI